VGARGCGGGRLTKEGVALRTPLRVSANRLQEISLEREAAGKAPAIRC
jgi:hypothetical protein